VTVSGHRHGQARAYENKNKGGGHQPHDPPESQKATGPPWSGVTLGAGWMVNLMLPPSSTSFHFGFRVVITTRSIRLLVRASSSGTTGLGNIARPPSTTCGNVEWLTGPQHSTATRLSSCQPKAAPMRNCQ
jgi:hypothetical protein